MKRYRVELVVDEGHIADTLRELANAYENVSEEQESDEYDFENGTAIIEEYHSENEDYND